MVLGTFQVYWMCTPQALNLNHDVEAAAVTLDQRDIDPDNNPITKEHKASKVRSAKPIRVVQRALGLVTRTLVSQWRQLQKLARQQTLRQWSRVKVSRRHRRGRQTRILHPVHLRDHPVHEKVHPAHPTALTATPTAELRTQQTASTSNCRLDTDREAVPEKAQVDDKIPTIRSTPKNSTLKQHLLSRTPVACCYQSRSVFESFRTLQERIPRVTLRLRQTVCGKKCDADTDHEPVAKNAKYAKIDRKLPTITRKSSGSL